MKEGDEGWLDFKVIKENTDVRLVLSHCGLLEHLEERGELITASEITLLPGMTDKGRFGFAIRMNAFCFHCTRLPPFDSIPFCYIQYNTILNN